MFIIKVKNKINGQVQQSDFSTREECDAWIVVCESKKSWGELDSYDLEIVDNTTQVTQDAINEAALKYLAETDWNVIKMMDSGTPLPDGMHVLRQQARDRIVR